MQQNVVDQFTFIEGKSVEIKSESGGVAVTLVRALLCAESRLCLQMLEVLSSTLVRCRCFQAVKTIFSKKAVKIITPVPGSGLYSLKSTQTANDEVHLI